MDYETWLKNYQAELLEKLQAELAEAAAEQKARVLNDPHKAERQLFLIKMVKLRLTRKLTQKDLATKLKTTQSTVSRIERNGNPSLNTLLGIAKALNAELVLKY